MQPHSLVLKSRAFTMQPPQKQTPTSAPLASSSKSQKGKRKSNAIAGQNSSVGGRKKRKTKGKGRLQEHDELSASDDLRSDEEYTEDIEMVNQASSNEHIPLTSSLQLENDEDEKPKPILQLRYRGFDIYGHCLCVVVEPWPPMRSMSRVTPALNREPSLAPPQSGIHGTSNTRGKTPLFLPDDDHGGERPPSFRDRRAPTSLLDPGFLEDSDNSDEDDGMMLFSQVLNNTGDTRAGAVGDDEDMDTDMFFGDADEIKEL
ncbi:hypothetical protein H0H93_000119 [Arthromyces matolae]|nr:hypothetical protein H0H93_000119 [Arthromyces matolae]